MSFLKKMFMSTKVDLTGLEQGWANIWDSLFGNNNCTYILEERNKRGKLISREYQIVSPYKSLDDCVEQIQAAKDNPKGERVQNICLLRKPKAVFCEYTLDFVNYRDGKEVKEPRKYMRIIVMTAEDAKKLGVGNEESV